MKNSAAAGTDLAGPSIPASKAVRAADAAGNPNRASHGARAVASPAAPRALPALLLLLALLVLSALLPRRAAAQAPVSPVLPKAAVAPAGTPPPYLRPGPRPRGTFAPGSTGAGGAAPSQGLPRPDARDPSLPAPVLPRQALPGAAEPGQPTFNPIAPGALAPAGAAPAPTDSLLFSFAEFRRLVSAFHPVARQAALNTDRARFEIRQARGAFDPNLNGKYYGKQFQGKDYYHDWETSLRVPTWFGVDVKAGWDRGVGPFVNPQEYTATSGLSYVGLSVPLGQGLLIDERRTALRVAQALAGLAEAERRAARNKLLLSAAKDYWEWALASQRLRLLTSNELVAAVRFAATRQRVLAGDLAPIDSVEALTELQNRQGQRVAGRVQWQNAGLVVSSYLWDADTRPRELPPTARPQALPPATAWYPLPPDSLAALAALAQQANPDLVKTRVKQVQLGLENRLLLNKLLPKLNLDYNLLLPGQPFALGNTPRPFEGGYSTNNYKLGLSLAYPLLLRAERAKRQLNQVKLREAGFQLDQDQRQVGNAVQAAANDWQALLEQLAIQEQAVRNYEVLRNGESIRFDNGESTVFLINSRESSLLASRQKLAELQAKYAQTQAQLRFAAGLDVPAGE